MSGDSTMHPVIHLLHDAGLAIWTGGSLMGAIGLNGAAAQLDDPAERARVSTRGWSRWAPVSAAGVAAHLIGGAGLTLTDLPRVRQQKGVLKSSVIKGVATGAATGVAVWDAVLNRRMAAAGRVPVAGATEPSGATPPDVARTLRQLQVVQWLNPAVGIGLLALTAWHEEQQRTVEQVKGRLQTLGGSRAGQVGLAAAALAGLGLLAARSGGSAGRGLATGGVSSAQPGEVVEVDLVEVDVIDLDAQRADQGQATPTGWS